MAGRPGPSTSACPSSSFHSPAGECSRCPPPFPIPRRPSSLRGGNHAFRGHSTVSVSQTVGCVRSRACALGRRRPRGGSSSQRYTWVVPGWHVEQLLDGAGRRRLEQMGGKAVPAMGMTCPASPALDDLAEPASALRLRALSAPENKGATALVIDLGLGPKNRCSRAVIHSLGPSPSALGRKRSAPCPFAEHADGALA